MPVATATGRVALGRALRELPAIEEAWLAGDIDAHHVRPHDGVMTGSPGAVAYWAQLADPDGTETDADTQHQRRRAHVSKSFDGLGFGEFVLDPIAGAAVSHQLDRICDELFRADRAADRADAGPGVEVTTVDVNRVRSPAQRRADALVEMARRAGTAPADGRRPAPRFTVFVGYETLAGRICEPADGTVVTPASLLSWLDQAYIERIVFAGPSRVIDAGAHRRVFDGATRRAIEV